MTVTEKISEITRPYRLRIAGGILLSLVLSGITAAIAWAVKPALDEVFVAKKYEYFKFLPAGVFILFALKGSVSFGQAYLMNSAALKLVRDMRNRLYDHILVLPLSHIQKESSGITISRIMYDVDSLRSLVSTIIKTFVVETPTVIFLLGLALYRKWDLTLMTLVLLPFIGLGTRKLGKRVKKRRKEAQRKLSLLTHKVGEALHGLRIIKIFNRRETMSEKFERENRQYYREMLKVVRFKEFTALLTEASAGIGLAVVLWYGGGMVVDGSITAGDFASIMVSIYMIFSPVKKLGDAYTSLQEAKASMERIDAVLDAKPEENGDVGISGFSGDIAFKGVSFKYEGHEKEAIKNVDLTIRRGEMVAIVGRSGAGKSTLMDLLSGFIRPTGGTVSIDGADLRSVELSSLRELIGIVSQDIILFNDTVKENIAFGRKGATEAEIVEAAKMAFADEFITGLPQGYESVIGERGLKLSGGQRQRIAIARAVLKNPPILILDEATSSLDSVSETLVQEALDKLMKGRTTVVIAHRLSTIRNADRIVVFEDGRITGQGTHEELMAAGGSYADLFNAYAFSS